jgi:hypothetical protein
MSRSRLAALSLALAGLTFPACSKTDKAPNGTVEGPPATAPVGAGENDTKGPPGAARTVPTDLSRYGVRGEMALPEGAVVERAGPGTWLVRAGDTFHVEISESSEPLAAAKAAWAAQNARLVRDEPGVVVAEYPGERFAFEARVVLGDTTYAVSTPADKTFPRDETDRMVAAALSLRQTEHIKAALQREAPARAALAAAGCLLQVTPDGPTLIVTGDKVTDADLAGVAGAGVSAVCRSNGCRSAAGL